MNRFSRAAGLVLAVLLLFGPAAAAAAPTAWTTEFRGSPSRLGTTSQGILGGAERVVSLPLGLSRAQPLFVGGTIYYAAGPYLWALDGAQLLAGRGYLFGDPEAPGFRFPWLLGRVRVHPSDYAVPLATPTYDAARGVLYVAVSCKPSNRHFLSAVRADFFRLPGQPEVIGEVPLSADAVSSPLVLPGGEVILGTRDGFLWIVRGLTEGHPRFRREPAGGLITSSPAPLGAHGFVIGRDGAPGAVQAYFVQHTDAYGQQREDFEFAWELLTPEGVPASFALSRGRLFFSDKAGVFYAVDLVNGTLVWGESFAHESLFINATPSVADGTVYYAVRQGPGRGKGEVIALDELTGALRWRGALPLQNPRGADGSPFPHANIGTLVTGDGHVLLGDSIGRLIIFRTGAGPERRQGSVYRLHADPAWVYLNPVYWQGLQGISSEITAAWGALLFSHVEMLPGGGERGFLNILRPGPAAAAPDIGVRRLSRDPSGAVRPGQTVEYRAALALRGANWPLTTAVFWRYAGDAPGTWRGWQEVALRPGESQEVVFSLPAPETSRDLVFAANPHAVALELHEDPSAAWPAVNFLPYYVVESDTANNIRTLPVAVSAAPVDLPNLRVRSIGVWEPYWADEWSEFAVWIELQGAASVSTHVHARIWREGEARPAAASEVPVTVQAGDWSRNELRFDFHPGSREGYLVIEVEVNPSGNRTVEERTYDDNVMRETVPVTRRPGPAVPGGVDPRLRVRLVR